MPTEQFSNSMLSEAPDTGVWVAVFPEAHDRFLNERVPCWLTDLKTRAQQWSVIMCNCLTCRAGNNAIP